MCSALTVLCPLFRPFYVFCFDCLIAYALFRLLYLFCFDCFMYSAPTVVCTYFYCFKCPATVLCALLHIFSSTDWPCRPNKQTCFNLSEKRPIPIALYKSVFKQIVYISLQSNLILHGYLPEFTLKIFQSHFLLHHPLHRFCTRISVT